MMRFEELGQHVARVQDPQREAVHATERAGRSFVRAIRRSPRRRAQTLLLAASAFAVAAAVCVFWIGRSSAPSLVLKEAPGVVIGQSIVVPRDRAIPLSFSDGSRLLLTAGTRASVESLTSDGANIEIENGQTDVSVVHRRTTKWALHAGPYRVMVTGTKFTLGWVPSLERFELNLSEGSVVVTTEQSSHAAVTMTAPEQLVIDHGDWQLSPASMEPVGNHPASVAVEGSVEPAKNVSPATPTVASAQSGTHVAPIQSPESAPKAPEWQRLGKLGQFAAAYTNASDVGIQNLSQTESAQSLLTLAEVCRFSGHASEAMRVLTKLRQRFAGKEEAAIAAFQLGRLSSDGQLAASWFRSYLRERPNGDLAREASGRLLEALDRAGDHAGAVAAARSYLEQYPSGPHASFARRLASP